MWKRETGNVGPRLTTSVLPSQRKKKAPRYLSGVQTMAHLLLLLISLVVLPLALFKG